LVEALPPDGVAVLNADDAYVKTFGRGMGDRAIFYGTDVDAQVRAENLEEAGVHGVRFDAVTACGREPVQLRLMGRHNVLNALGAMAAGLRSGISLKECAAAVAELRPPDKRGEVLEWRGATLINDCYNSNPRALDAMVDALMATPGGRHIVIAGEMLELGPEAAALHAACGQRMAEQGVSAVVGVRGAARSLVEAASRNGTKTVFVETPEEARTWLQSNVRAGDVVLLKASRGVRLERALADLGD
jgi:UDP-N-acetylmuramoyl-tripeptide--D-alanyl-D-alanine ligase